MVDNYVVSIYNSKCKEQIKYKGEDGMLQNKVGTVVRLKTLGELVEDGSYDNFNIEITEHESNNYELQMTYNSCCVIFDRDEFKYLGQLGQVYAYYGEGGYKDCICDEKRPYAVRFIDGHIVRLLPSFMIVEDDNVALKEAHFKNAQLEMENMMLRDLINTTVDSLKALKDLI